MCPFLRDAENFLHNNIMFFFYILLLKMCSLCGSERACSELSWSSEKAVLSFSDFWKGLEMKALLDKFRHNGSPIKSSPDTDLDLFHFFCVIRSYFSAVTAWRAIRLSKAFPALGFHASQERLSPRGDLAHQARLQHQQRQPLPFLGLPVPGSSQGRTPFKIRYFTTPPLGESSAVCRVAGPLFLVVMKEAIPTVWYILCHRELHS